MSSTQTELQLSDSWSVLHLLQYKVGFDDKNVSFWSFPKVIKKKILSNNLASIGLIQ